MAIIKLRKGESEMKTKYIRDFRHNYLVIEKEDPGQIFDKNDYREYD